MLQALCLILMVLTLPCAAQLNYQERAIYLGEGDNVCKYGSNSDMINLVVNLDDAEIVKDAVWGLTICYEWVLPYSSAISPADVYHYDEPYKDHEIEFQDETRYVQLYGVIIKIIQKTTINSAKFYGKDYDCTIRGDGTVQHFGIKFKDFEPATFYIKCTSKSLSGEAE